jgi:AcrR family transcriptional regulator
MTDVAADSGSPGRRADARRNRRLILRAARDCFAEIGTLVPFEEIALRAGVGKGTVYRHFSTRQELIDSLAEQFYLESHRVCDQALAHEDAWEGLRLTLLGVGDRGILYENVLRSLVADPPSQKRMEMSLSLAQKLDQITKRAVDAGVARQGLTGNDIGILSRMLAGVQGLTSHALTAQDRRRVADVILSGLRPRGR